MKKFLDMAIISLLSIIITLYAVQLRGKKPTSIDGGTAFSESNNDHISALKNQIAAAFDEAETKILNINPSPDIVGPHEDPKKCICKGSGVIVQGDGHKTVCPYHGNGFGEKIIIKPLIKMETLWK